MRRASRNALEHAIQRAVFDWRAIMVGRFPELNLLHAVPNGAGLRHTVRRRLDGQVTRFSAEGVKLRREGMTSGVPDVSFPCARGPYHGLYIEHKAGKNGTSKAQRDFMELLRAERYLCVVSRDAAYSIDVIQRYLAQGRFRDAAPTLSV